MTCSPARLAANRANALRSTGPRSAAGKAAARQNAFRHGMAGRGDLIGPGEDQDLVARRAVAFATELGVTGEIGALLAYRAALLSVRMKRASERELVAVAAAMEQAQVQFDQDRRDELAELVASLAAGGAGSRRAIVGLAESPAGLAHLIDAWGAIRAELGSMDGETVRRATARARDWLNRDGPASGADLLDRVAAEVVRLQGLLAGMADFDEFLAQLRAEAGLLASFDPSPAAALARRYEAMAERGMYRAIRAIAELNRSRGRDPQGVGDEVAAVVTATNAPPPFPSRPPAPASPTPPPPPLIPRTAPADLAPMGSFRAGVQDAASSLPMLIGAPGEPSLIPTPPRKKRPDLRKLGRSR